MIKETLTGFILKAIRNNWSITALADYSGKSYTYGHVAGYMVHLHARFEAYGIKPGDKIALLGKNSANWGISYLSVITYGAVVVPILPDFKPNDVHHIINHSESRLLLVADNLFDNLDPGRISAVMGVISLNDFSVLHSSNGEGISHLTEKTEQIYQKKICTRRAC